MMNIRARHSGSSPDAEPRVPADLRQQIAALLLDRLDVFVADATALFPLSGIDALDPDYCRRIGRHLGQLLAIAVRDGRCDAGTELLAYVQRLASDRSVSVARLFAFAHLTERTALDELALSASIGATTEAWPAAAQLVRRASIDVLAAYTERLQAAPTSASLIDHLTTVYTRSLFDAVLSKELEKAGRTGGRLSVILFDVDRLAAINAENGYGVGDKVLARVAVTVRQYFRHQDWVARYEDDAIAVLLTATEGRHATELAERVRATIAQRLAFQDHRTEQLVRVTVSVAVVNLRVSAGDIYDPERLLVDADSALVRARSRGGDQVASVDVDAGSSRTPLRNSPSA